MNSNQFEKYESKKQHRRLLVVSLRKQHRLFVREGLDDTPEDLSEKPNDLENDTSYENWQDLSDVTNQFKLGIYLPIQVKPNEQVMVFKNGVRQPGFLMPGRHVLVNKDPLFTRYQIYRFNTQVVTLKALIDGRVHDPHMNLDLRVIAEFRILCRLEHYEQFLLGVDRPLRLFYTIFNDMVFEELVTLKHDLLGKWASELKNRVFKRLKEEKGEVKKQIGIEVVGVYVDNLSNNPMYVELHDEIFGFKAGLWRDVAKAKAQREEADILGINASHIRFDGTDMGRVAMEGDMDLKKIQASFGSLFPQLPPASGNQPSDSTSVESVLPLFAPSPPPSQISPPVPTPRVARPSSGDNASQELGGENNPVSEERQEQEITALRQAGFAPEGRGHLDAERWDISVTTRLPNNDLLTISFRCGGNYPHRPPTVYTFSSAHGRRVLQQLESLLNWDFHMMLVDIAEEVRHILSAEFAGGSQ